MRTPNIILNSGVGSLNWALARRARGRPRAQECSP